MKHRVLSPSENEPANNKETNGLWNDWLSKRLSTKFSLGQCLNTLRPRQSFGDNVFKCTFVSENVWFSTRISLECVPWGLIDIYSIIGSDNGLAPNRWWSSHIWNGMVAADDLVPNLASEHLQLPGEILCGLHNVPHDCRQNIHSE